MKTTIMTFVILLTLFFASNLAANNLKILSEPKLVNINSLEKTTDIKFSVSWENSWRSDIDGQPGYAEPYNYDAIWVFIKYKVSDTEHPQHPYEPWNHATLHATGHSAPVIATIDVPEDKKGAFIYRSQNGSGSIELEDVKLRWDYGYSGIDELTSIDIKVFAIEMVYIPEGSFYVGHDGITTNDQGHFYKVVADINDFTNPYEVEGEGSITLGGSSIGNLGSTVGGISVPDDFNTTTTRVLSADFPKGFQAFYIMKHAITQKQYVDFLNTLTRRQQKNRTYLFESGYTSNNVYAMTNSSEVFTDPGGDSPGENYRNGIRFDPANFGTNSNEDPPLYFFCDLNENGVPNEADDGQHVYCNFLSGNSSNDFTDVAAYLDWAALRPMTELEYEKAARGAGQPAGLDIWAGGIYTPEEGRLVPSDIDDYLAGIDDYIVNRNLSNELPANEDHYCAYGLPGRKFGPTRAGIFARADTDRLSSGASHYGVLDLSGNLWERVVSVSIVEGVGFYCNNYEFTGSHGDGNLSVNGNANISNWPVMLGVRGGAFGFHQRQTRISDRWRVNDSFASRAGEARGIRSHGGRGVRTTP